MPADLRELLERTAVSPATPVDPAQIASRSRRRTRRRRGSAGLTGVALVALLALVAWPGGVPGDGLTIEDRTADQPEAPVLDLPEGWVQVEVGDAVFGIPGELEIVEIDADDPLPCDNVGNRAYVATESYPVATRDAAGNEYACNAAGNDAPQLFAAPLSAVPAAHLGGDSWSPRSIGGLGGEWRLGKVAPPDDDATDGDGAEASDNGQPERTAWYRVPAVDLHLRFVTTEADVDLVEAILATITPLGTTSEEAPSAAERFGGVPEREWVLMHTYGPRRDITMVEVREADGSPVMTLDTRQDASEPNNADATVIWRGHDGCAEFEFEAIIEESSVAVTGDVLADDQLDDCSTEREEAAVAYAEALQDLDQWETQGELLELLGPETWMVFEPLVVDDPPPGLVAPEDADLWDRPWIATSVTGDGASVALVDGTELTVSFDRFQSHATLGFSAGCNSFGGQLWITPRSLRLVEGGGTEIGCDGPLERQDGYFARYFFRSTLDWELDGDRLTLTDGSTIIELEAGSAEHEQD